MGPQWPGEHYYAVRFKSVLFSYTIPDLRIPLLNPCLLSHRRFMPKQARSAPTPRQLSSSASASEPPAAVGPAWADHGQGRGCLDSLGPAIALLGYGPGRCKAPSTRQCLATVTGNQSGIVTDERGGCLGGSPITCGRHESNQ